MNQSILTLGLLFCVKTLFWLSTPFYVLFAFLLRMVNLMRSRLFRLTLAVVASKDRHYAAGLIVRMRLKMLRRNL